MVSSTWGIGIRPARIIHQMGGREMKPVAWQFKSKKDGKWHSIIGSIEQDSIKLGLEGFDVRPLYAIGDNQIVVDTHALMHWYDVMTQMMNSKNPRHQKAYADQVIKQMMGLAESNK
jgi:hypothetical protein